MDLPDPPKSREDVDQEAFARAAKRQEATEQKQRRSGVISVAFVILVVVGLFYWYGGNADKPVPGASSPPAVSIVDEQTVADQTRDQVAAIITTEDPSTGVVHVNTVVSQMEAGTGC